MALFAFGKYEGWGEYFIAEASNIEEAKEKVRNFQEFKDEVDSLTTYLTTRKTTEETAKKKAIEETEKKYFSHWKKVEDGVWLGEWA